MADKFLGSLSALAFKGDSHGIFDAGDVPAVPAAPMGRMAIKFADGTNESAAVSRPFGIPADFWTSGSGLKLKIYYFGSSAPGTANKVDFEGCVEAISEGDPHNLASTADAFAAPQGVVDTIDANAGELCVAEIAFTKAQADDLEPGDCVRIALRRDSDDLVNDTYADAVWVVHVDLYEMSNG